MRNYHFNYNAIISVIYNASGIIRRDFYEIESLKVSQQGAIDFTNKTYTKLKKVLVNSLRTISLYYQDMMSLDETISNNVKYSWLVKPINGIINFTQTIPLFCMSIALVVEKRNNKKTILGIIYNPILNELFWAGENMGAFKMDVNGIQKRLGSLSIKSVKKLIYTLSSGMAERIIIKNIKNKNFHCRIIGSINLELAYLADSRISLVLTKNINIWSYAAGLIIAKESGHIMADADFIERNFNSFKKGSIIIIASSDIIKYLKKAKCQIDLSII